MTAGSESMADIGHWVSLTIAQKVNKLTYRLL